MDVRVEPGRYVIAVSGGVDSMVLLHLLQQQPGVKLTVAHFDHGIREDSRQDRLLVQSMAKQLGLPFVYNEGGLGPGVSEDAARTARYHFLRQVQQAAGARALLTAHHQDDALETAIFNLLRGTGRKGLSSLGNHHDLHRPMLHVPKVDIINHAREHNLPWREDSTNQDLNYGRNYIRHRIMPRLDGEAREKLWQLIRRQQELNAEIDELLVNQLHLQTVTGTIDRRWFARLSHVEAKELLAAWLRSRGIRQFDKKTLERLSVQAKIGQPGKAFDIVNGHRLKLTDDHLALMPVER